MDKRAALIAARNASKTLDNLHGLTAEQAPIALAEGISDLSKAVFWMIDNLPSEPRS